MSKLPQKYKMRFKLSLDLIIFANLWFYFGLGGQPVVILVMTWSFLVYQYGQDWSENRFRVTLIKTSGGLENF